MWGMDLDAEVGGGIVNPPPHGAADGIVDKRDN